MTTPHLIHAVVNSDELKGYSLEAKIAYALYSDNHFPLAVKVDGIERKEVKRGQHDIKVFKANGLVKYYKKVRGTTFVVVNDQQELMHLAKVNKTILQNLDPELSALYTSYLKLLQDNQS